MDIKEVEAQKEDLKEDHILEVKKEEVIINQVGDMIDPIDIEAEEVVIEKEIEEEEIDRQVPQVHQIVVHLLQMNQGKERETEIIELRTKFQSNIIINIKLIIGTYILTFRGKRGRKFTCKTKEENNDYSGMGSNG